MSGNNKKIPVIKPLPEDDTAWITNTIIIDIRKGYKNNSLQPSVSDYTDGNYTNPHKQEIILRYLATASRMGITDMPHIMVIAETWEGEPRLIPDACSIAMQTTENGKSRITPFIVITQSLLDTLTPDEIEALLGHELGHVKKNLTKTPKSSLDSINMEIAADKSAVREGIVNSEAFKNALQKLYTMNKEIFKNHPEYYGAQPGDDFDELMTQHHPLLPTRLAHIDYQGKRAGRPKE